MKRCLQCRRDYYDETLLYCLDDGAALVDGPASVDEPATAVFTTGESQTRAFTDSPDRQDSQKRTTSNRTRLFGGVAGLLVLATLGLAIYLYYGKPTGEINSIAVLPFVNESGNPDIEYLSDGMTETLINNLSQIPKLSVKARSSVFRYKGKEVEPQKVAADLNVQAVVNGRVLQRGDDLTLNLEMVDARTGDQLWGQRYVRKLGDIVALQSEVADDVYNKLRQRLLGTEARAVSKRGTENPEAYQLYLKGRYHWNKRTAVDIRKSIDYFQQAVDKDPTYALGYAGLADGYVVMPSYSNDLANEFFPKARAAAQKALAMDETLAEAHAALADVLFEFDWKFAESEREFKRAIELDPNYATAHHWYAELLLSLGRSDEAMAELRRAQECDPLSLIINSVMGIAHLVRGENELAEEQLEKTIELDPNFARAHLFLAEVYEAQGKYEQAFGAYEKHLLLIGMPSDEVGRTFEILRNAYKAAGPEGFFRARLASYEKLLAADSEVKPPYFVVAVEYMRVGDRDRGFQFLERSFKEREPDILRLHDRSLDPVRSDPRYQDLVRRIGLPSPKG